MLTEGTNIGEMHFSSRLLDKIGIAYIFKDFSNFMKQMCGEVLEDTKTCIFMIKTAVLSGHL